MIDNLTLAWEIAVSIWNLAGKFKINHDKLFSKFNGDSKEEGFLDSTHMEVVSFKSFQVGFSIISKLNTI